MNKFNILNYLEKRQLGYNAGPKRDVYDMYIEKLRYIPVENIYTRTADSEIGNTFACKFSRNKSNLHVLGCASEYGKMVIQNTHSNVYNYLKPKYESISLHENAIFNFAWAEPQMKLVTACGDQSSKLCSLHPSGTLHQERQFIHNSSVRSVMFCPGSSDIFCGGCQDSTIKVWDARINNENSVVNFETNIPNAHGNLEYRRFRTFGISSVIYKNEQVLISSSTMDPAIKMWDLRKSYRQVGGMREPLPLMKFVHESKSVMYSGYDDMIINPQHTMLYASGINSIIYCYSLEMLERNPIAQYTGYTHETNYSKISITNDGHYLFSGCLNNGAVIWKTGQPYINEPIIKLYQETNYPQMEELRKIEHATSDWCADTSSLKLATSGDCMPTIWTMTPDDAIDDYPILKLMKTENYRFKLRKEEHYVPIRVNSELKEKLMEESEISMEIWDLENTNSEIKNVEVKNVEIKNVERPKQPEKITLSVTKDKSPAVTVQASRKRKRCTSQNYIDQYFKPKKKEENLNTDLENGSKNNPL